MQYFIFSIFLFLSTSIFSANLTKTWESEKVFKTPESINYFSYENCLLISNINGNPSEKDGNGFISKISTDGKIINLEWIKGLNAPKGAAIYKNKMVVTDIDRIAVIDLKKGKIKRFIDIPGSKFLNDVAVDSKGIFYISDSSGKNSKIYAFNGEKTYVWLSGEEVQSPNGLYVNQGDLFFGSSGDGIIKKVDLKSKKITHFSKVGRGIDGLKLTANNCFITTDWQGHCALACQDGNMTELLDTTKDKINAADIEYLPGKKLVIIPTFFDNRCVAYTFQ